MTDGNKQRATAGRTNEAMASGFNVRQLPTVVHIKGAAVLLFLYFDDSNADHNASGLRWLVVP